MSREVDVCKVEFSRVREYSVGCDISCRTCRIIRFCYGSRTHLTEPVGYGMEFAQNPWPQLLIFYEGISVLRVRVNIRCRSYRTVGYRYESLTQFITLSGTGNTRANTLGTPEIVPDITQPLMFFVMIFSFSCACVSMTAVAVAVKGGLATDCSIG